MCTPALVNAGALVAERKWTYVWDLFLHEPDRAVGESRALADGGIATNRKVAVVHDNGPDGHVVEGELKPKIAKNMGDEVVMNASFPADNTPKLCNAVG